MVPVYSAVDGGTNLRLFDKDDCLYYETGEQRQIVQFSNGYFLEVSGLYIPR